MKLPGKEIANTLQTHLKKEVQILAKQGKKLKLLDILIGEGADQTSFIKIKEQTAHKLGIGFEFEHFIKTPSFEVFANQLKVFSQRPDITGIIVQQPLPFQLQTDSLYNFIPLSKEIEGHKLKSTFSAPIGLAVMTALKYMFNGNKINTDLFVDPVKDGDIIKKSLRGKKIIIVGKGMTGGNPVGKTLNKYRIDYMSIGSQTFEPEQYYKDADIIITAVGKKIISPEMLKPGVILLNVGVRREEKKLKGDYDDAEIKDIASLYSPTPGGIGPIDVMYLYKNLIDAAKLQM